MVKIYGSVRAEDFFIRGSAILNKNTFILCPDKEAEEIAAKNPKCNIIPYKADNVMEYVNSFIGYLGYIDKTIEAHGIKDDFTYVFQNKIYSALENEGIDVTGLKDPHSNTYEIFCENNFLYIEMAKASYEKIKQQNLPIDRLKLSLSQTPPYHDAKKNALDKKIDFNETKKRLQHELVPFGMSELQLIHRNSGLNTKSTSLRAQENFKIENFLGNDISKHYEEDMVITNIKRIKLIIAKMQANNLENDQNAINILKYAVSHLCEDLGDKGKFYKEGIEEDGKNWEDHVQKLNKLLMPLGLSVLDFREQDLSEKNILKTMQEFFTIQDIMERNGIKENYENKDILLININRKKQLDEIIEREFEKSIKEDETVTIDDEEMASKILSKYILKKINSEYKEYIEEQGYNWSKYASYLDKNLIQIGMSSEDFLNASIIENENKMNKIISEKKYVILQIGYKDVKEMEEETGHPTEELIAMGFSTEEIYEFENKFNPQTAEKLDRKKVVEDAITARKSIMDKVAKNEDQRQKIIDEKKYLISTIGYKDVKELEEETGHPTEELLAMGFSTEEIDEFGRKFDKKTGEKLDRKKIVEDAIKVKNIMDKDVKSESQRQKIIDEKEYLISTIGHKKLKEWEEETGHLTEELLIMGFSTEEIDEFENKFDTETGEKLDRKKVVEDAITARKSIMDKVVKNEDQRQKIIDEKKYLISKITYQEVKEWEEETGHPTEELLAMGFSTEEIYEFENKFNPQTAEKLDRKKVVENAIAIKQNTMDKENPETTMEKLVRESLETNPIRYQETIQVDQKEQQQIQNSKKGEISIN